MSEGKVKRWTPQCDESGAFLLESGGRGAVTYQQTVVLATDFDRVSAENDSLAAEAQRLRAELAQAQADAERHPAPAYAESERTTGVLPLPDFTVVEDDGDISVEWYCDSCNLLSISINGKRCHAAWMTNGESGCTAWDATDAVPDDVRAALSALSSALSNQRGEKA